MAPFRIALLNLAAACLLAGQAAAQLLTISPSGQDSGNCRSSPCASIQYAADQVGMATFGTLMIQPGAYYGKLNFYEWHRLSISGPINVDGSCVDPGLVWIIDQDANTTALVSQDHATVIVQCATLVAAAPGISLLHARQLSILDYQNLKIGSIGSGNISTVVSASDFGVASCNGTIYFVNDAAVYAMAAGGTINAGCKHTGSNMIGYLLDAADGGRIEASLATWGSLQANVGAVADSGIINALGSHPPGAVVGPYNFGVIK